MLNRDIVNEPTLRLLSTIVATKLPSVAAFKIGMNLEGMQKVVDSFNKQKNALVEQYTLKIDGEIVRPIKADGTKDETAVQLSNPAEFEKAIEDLLNVDVTDVCPILVVRVSELGTLELAPQEAQLIKWMLSL